MVIANTHSTGNHDTTVNTDTTDNPGATGNQDTPDIFPMTIVCTGCSTRYRINRARRFNCPHCGNGVEIHKDGKLEITQGAVKAPAREKVVPEKKISNKETEKALAKTDVEKLEETEPDEPTFIISAGKKKMRGAGKGDEPEEKTEPDETAEPEGRMEQARKAELSEKIESEKTTELVEKVEPEEAPETSGEIITKEVTGDVVVAEKVEDDREKSPVKKEVKTRDEPLAEEEPEATEKAGGVVTGTKPEKIRTQETIREGRISAGKEKDRIPGGKEKELMPVGGKEVKSSEIGDASPALKPSTIDRFAPRGPLAKGFRKRAVAAILVVLIILIAIVAYSMRSTEEFSVTMPEEKIGDRGTYDVTGKMWASSDDGVSSSVGLINDLQLNLKGQTTLQINETTTVKDGFSVERETIDRYLYQNLKLSGSAEIGGSVLRDDDAGTITTKSTSYTCLVTNKTVQTRVYNDLDIDINIITYNRAMQSVDNGIYYPSGDGGGGFDLFNLDEREYSLGDEGDLANGQLLWKAEKKEKVYQWDTIKLHITENGTGADWREISGDVWVANECSLPVKVYVNMKVNTEKLSPELKTLMKLLTSSSGALMIDYTATMKGYKRGEKNIPWDTYGENPTITQRAGVQYDDDWKYVPKQRLTPNGSFDFTFTPEMAVDYANNTSDGLESYIERHKDDVYVVDGIYSIDNGTQSWQFMFGYREKGLTATSTGYNITVKKIGVVWTLDDIGQESINNPSNSRPEIGKTLNIADSEGVFGEMELLSPLFIGNDAIRRIDFVNNVSFEMQNNLLHSGLSFSSFNPFMQNTIPAGYGYYLQKEDKNDDEYTLIEGMVDTKNGRMVYQIDHYQKG